MKKTIHVQIAIGVICLIMAFAITIQIRSVSYNRVNNTDTARAADLQQQLRVEKDRTKIYMSRCSSSAATLKNLSRRQPKAAIIRNCWQSSWNVLKSWRALPRLKGAVLS